jgi:hypothetical protein
MDILDNLTRKNILSFFVYFIIFLIADLFAMVHLPSGGRHDYKNGAFQKFLPLLLAPENLVVKTEVKRMHWW